MLKLPAIVTGLALIVWALVLRNWWLLSAGLPILALGLFVLPPDFGRAPDRPEAGTDAAAELGDPADRPG
jgi:hypothetical protein